MIPSVVMAWPNFCSILPRGREFHTVFFGRACTGYPEREKWGKIKEMEEEGNTGEERSSFSRELLRAWSFALAEARG
jgi:hypothetical protein